MGDEQNELKHFKNHDVPMLYINLMIPLGFEKALISVSISSSICICSTCGRSKLRQVGLTRGGHQTFEAGTLQLHTPWQTFLDISAQESRR